MEWLATLEELIDQETLRKYDKIFYLNSIVAVEMLKIDEIVESEKLVSFLSVEETDDTSSDILDFFLLENDEVRDVMVVLSPHDLFEDESLFKFYPNVQEDFSDLETLEQLK